MKTPLLCTLIITAMLTNSALAKTPLSYKIDDLEYQPYQIMTNDEMASTTGKAIPVLLAPILWGALQGASVNLSLYFAEAAVSGKKPTFKQAFIEAATGAGLGSVTGPVNLNIFLKGETAALFIGGLKGTYLGNGKNKTGPAFDSVPTKQDLDRVLNDKNWSDQHFKKIMGPNYTDVFKKALDDPKSWKNFTAQKCTSCH
ncbi:hypothetical protein ACFXNG_004474 [Salmonella enterica]